MKKTACYLFVGLLTICQACDEPVNAPNLPEITSEVLTFSTSEQLQSFLKVLNESMRAVEEPIYIAP